jgi:hypothetical protein
VTINELKLYWNLISYVLRKLTEKRCLTDVVVQWRTIQQTLQFSAALTKIHEAVVKRGLQYLNGSRNEGITFSGSKDGKLRLAAYSDADWAGDKENGRSISGFVATINGAAISWSAKKQGSVATSSTEVEYMALSTAVKEVIWIQRMFKELGRTWMMGRSSMRTIKEQLLWRRTPSITQRPSTLIQSIILSENASKIIELSCNTSQQQVWLPMQ